MSDQRLFEEAAARSEQEVKVFALHNIGAFFPLLCKKCLERTQISPFHWCLLISSLFWSHTGINQETNWWVLTVFLFWHFQNVTNLFICASTVFFIPLSIMNTIWQTTNQFYTNPNNLLHWAISAFGFSLPLMCPIKTTVLVTEVRVVTSNMVHRVLQVKFASKADLKG